MTIAAVVRGASPTPGSPTRRAPSSWTPRLVVLGAPSTMVPVPTVLLPLPTNAQGLFLIKTDWPPGVPAGFAATNGVASTAQ